ncbi:MAG: hypothetical protein NTW49_09315, partial [Bacteroidia bacterium]|nr:hypothetical protein [Bacteroidia bacterium]
MKRLIYILILLTGLSPGLTVHAQTIVDTVCAGQTGKHYWVSGSPGSTFTWSISGVSSTVYLNDTIHVNWGNVPGSYPVSVVETSAQGCHGAPVSGNIIVMPLPVVNLGNDTSVCANSGYVLNAGPGAASYHWQDGSSGQYYTVVNTGDYWVSVSNSHGCSITDSIHVGLLPVPVVNLGPDTISCNGASIVLNAGAGFATYHWSNGSSLQTLTVSVSGTYAVTVTNAAGCSNSDTINVTISPPVSLTATINNVTCNSGNNGTIDMTVTGAISPYTYNWSNGSTNQDISGLAAGQYTVTVTDAIGCSATAVFNIIQTDAIITTAVITNVSCHNLSDGAIDLSVSGGTSPFTYHWSTNATSQDITGLAGAVYIVTVTDSHGCAIISSFTVINPAAITTSIIPTPISCFGSSTGQADLTVNGGTPPFTYFWSNGFSTQDLTNVPAGYYSVLVFDSNNCLVNSNVTITQSPAIITSVTGVNVSCAGLSNGSANLTVSGGTPPYTYLWSNSATTLNITGLTAGQYSVSVTDSLSCLHTATITITVPLTLTLNLTPTPVLCYG